MDVRTTRIIVAPAPGNVTTGASITFTVEASAPLVVTPGAGGSLPRLSLSDGEVASFSSVDASGNLVFTGVIGAPDASPDLRVTGLDLNGATIDGQGTDGFTSQVFTALAVAPVAVATADLWNTGTVDLVTANQDGSLTVLAGHGDGTFQAPVIVPTGIDPTAVLAVDVGNSGTPDLIAIGSGQVVELAPNPDGTYQQPVTLDAIGDRLTSVIAADLFGNGAQDLVITDATGLVEVLDGAADGSFTPGQVLAAGRGPAGVAAGAFVTGGLPGLAVTNSQDDTVSIFLNASGTLTAVGTLATGGDPTGIVAGDFAHDGTIDLAVANSADDTITVFIGNGDGTFQPGVTYAAEGGVAELQAVDLNHDGTLDLVAGNLADGSISVLLGNGDGTFQPEAVYATGAPLTAFAATALTSTGPIDVVTANGGADSVTALLNTGPVGLDPSVQGAALDISGLAGLAGADTGLAVNPAHQDTLVTLASFDPTTTGSIAVGPLAVDAAGDVLGVAGVSSENGAGGIDAWSASLQTLTTPCGFYWSAQNQQPVGGLTVDAAGNLYGVTAGNADGLGGEVYEITSTGGQIPLAEFPSGVTPSGRVSVDAAGDVFGTTQNGGGDGAGSVFEYVASSGTLVDLADFDGGALGGGPTGGVIADASGNLFGTTQTGGANGYGTVFEYVASTQTLTTLASFDWYATGYMPSGPLVEDEAGNLYGEAQSLGYPNWNGSIFEVQAGTGTIQMLYSFTGGNDGGTPVGGLLLDGQGNLFGTTADGGRHGAGTVFELSADHHTLITLDALQGGTLGANPDTGLVADEAGNLYGATSAGGTSGSGVLFEVQDSAYGAPVICFYPGTRIRTLHGFRSVERLEIGDLVLTVDGSAEPVRWVGRQTVRSCAADPLRVLPIRIRKGALGDGLPVRDLLLSPDHAVAIDGILIQAAALVNGVSITRETRVPESFTYYHVELASHELILAEDQPVETFIDNVERWAFDNWAEHEALYGVVAEMAELDRPRAHSRRQVPRAIRARIDGMVPAVADAA